MGMFIPVLSDTIKPRRRPPLDGVADIVAAYSTRLLRSLYVGNCLRLRRDSDDNESDFGFLGNMIDVAAIAVWLGAANGYVKTWYDQSGNGNDLSQAVDNTYQPLYVAAGVNGYPILRFDGVNDRLTRNPLQFDSEKTVVAALSNDDDNTEHRWFTNVKDAGDGRSRGLWNSETNNNYFGYTERIAIDTFIRIYNTVWGAWHTVASTAKENDVMLLWVDDLFPGMQPIANFGFIAPSIMVVGSNRNQNAQWFDGDMFELIIADAVIPDATLTTLRQNVVETIGNTWLPVTSTGSDVLYQAGEVNGRNYKKNQIVSTDFGGTEYQATAFWNEDGNLVLWTRSGGGVWTKYYYPHTIAANDDHRVITLGFDSSGYLHMAYDHHDNVPSVARSDNPINLFDGYFTRQPLIGSYPSQITYAQFFTAPDGTLFITYRSGAVANGDQFLLQFNEITETWDAPAGVANGWLLDNAGIENCPFFIGMAFDSDFGTGGFAHLSWVWRNGTNHDVGYVRWDGANWTQTGGGAQVIPITSLNQETADAVGVGNALSNGGDIASDDNGFPHIVYVKDDGSGFLQIYHTWHNGVGWATAALTAQATVLSGLGFPEDNEWREPDIAIDQSNGHAYVIYTLLTKTGIIVLDSLNYVAWTETQIYGTAVGQWSPTYDPWQFVNNDELHFAICPYPPAVDGTPIIFEYPL